MKKKQKVLQGVKKKLMAIFNTNAQIVGSMDIGKSSGYRWHRNCINNGVNMYQLVGLPIYGLILILLKKEM